MSLRESKMEMVQLLELNRQKFVRGDANLLFSTIENNSIDDLDKSAFEEMFDMFVRNIEHVKYSDFLAMYQLFYWKVTGAENGRVVK
jgi:hypothetical protein|tara:strand:+ start:204 stop:464 length:261 start_codon:yes stop_codon:yes gene_type:complete